MLSLEKTISTSGDNKEASVEVKSQTTTADYLANQHLRLGWVHVITFAIVVELLTVN